MKKELRILILEDNADDAALIERTLRQGGVTCVCNCVSAKQQFLDALVQSQPDLILSDHNLPGFTGSEAMSLALGRYPDMPFILVSGVLGEDTAARIISNGATDYVPKSRLVRLVPTVLRAAREAEQRSQFRLAEAKFQAALDVSPDAMVLCDGSGKIVHVNRKAELMFGYNRGELTGADMTSIVPSRLFGHMQPDGAAHARARQPDTKGTEVDLLGVRKDGQRLVVDVRLSPMEEARATLVLAAIRDVTLRRDMERKLRDSELRFRQLAENIREVFWMTDISKRQVIYVSPGYEQIWGRTCQSLYSSPMDWMEAIHPDDRVRIEQAAATRQVAGLYNEQYRIVRPDGSIRWIQDRAFPIRDTTGKVYRLAGIAEDISDRKRAEREAVAFSGLGYRLSAATAPEQAGRIILEVAADLFGWDAGYVHLYSNTDGKVIPVLTVDTIDGRRQAIAPSTSFPMPTPLMQRVLKEGAQLINRPDDRSRNFKTLPFGDVHRLSASIMCVPITSQGTPVGFLSVQSYHHGAYSPDDLVLLQALAGYCGDALHRINVEREVLEISAFERRRIGHELHDGLGQFLCGIAFQAAALEQSLVDQGAAHAQEAKAVAAAIRDALKQTRGMARGWDPVEVGAMGLATALQNLAAETEKLFRISCEVTCAMAGLRESASSPRELGPPLDSAQTGHSIISRGNPASSLLSQTFAGEDAGSPKPDPQVAITLYRLTQEAIHNAITHGEAARIRISLAEGPHGLQLRIEDDGKGFDSSNPNPTGMGLRVMDYRARSIGGRLEITSQPGRGTKVDCLVGKG